MVIYPEQVGARPSVAPIMMINFTISCSPWVPDFQASMMAKWYTKVTTHSRPVSVILVKSQLLINVTLPRVGNWTMDWSNFPLVQQKSLHWVIVCPWKNGWRICECSALCPRHFGPGGLDSFPQARHISTTVGRDWTRALSMPSLIDPHPPAESGAPY